MERITFDGNFCDIVMCHNVDGSSPCEKGTCDLKRTWERLKEIENILGKNYDLDRLKWLVEMDKTGMFISVPCKVGDTVYVITNKGGCLCIGKEIVECEVNTMRVKSDGITIGYSCRGRYSNGNPYIGNFVFKSIGKTVFLTHEDAEAALKG